MMHNLFLDFHTHQLRRQDQADIKEIVSLHLGREVEHQQYTIAKHPWWTEEVLSDSEKELLKKHLTSQDCLAMGEMGLDKLKGPKMEQQITILKSQLDLAQEVQKPVIIHCVRAYDQLLQVKKLYPSIPQWCVHGFARNSTLALQLIDKGFYISLMPVFEITDNYKQLVRALPLDRFFLETDSMPNIQIETVYLQVAELLELDIQTLQQQMIHNTNVFFGNE